jgi:dihydroflavonol-4-reductase
MQPDPREWRGRRVCVTGGTGLLGFQIVREARALGARVRVLALSPLDVHPLRAMPDVECIFGDIRDRDLVGRALAGSDVVFHTAGVVAAWGPALGWLHAVHVEGTRHVLETAERSARVVHTSSIVTVGARTRPDVLTEESEFGLDGLKVDYVTAKRAAEQLALEHAAAGRDVVVTNPGYLIGPEDFESSVMGRFCRRFWRGLVPVAPPGGFNLVDVRDVARGHLLAAERGRSGRRYILGGENLAFPAFMTLLSQVGGLRPRAIPTLPWWALIALATCSEGRAKFTHLHPYPALQHARMNRYFWFYDAARAEVELGYHARPLVDALADTRRWCASWASLRVRGASRWWMRPGALSERAA